MRKSLRISIILLIVMLCLVAVGAASLGKTATQVTVEELNSFGDKSAAEGIQLSIPVGVLDGRLSWTTEYAVGSEIDTESAFRLYQQEQTDRWRLDDKDKPRIEIAIYGTSLQYDNSMEFYSLSVKGIVVQKHRLKNRQYNDGRFVPEYEEFTAFSNARHWVNAQPSGNPEENLCRGMAYKVNTGSPVVAYSVSEATDRNLYYAVDLRLKEGGRPSAEIFEEGYGVRRIGYQVKEINGEVKLALTENMPELVCEIDPQEALLKITVSEDEKYLYVFTAKEQTCYLSVIDLEEKKPEQKLELITCDVEGIPEILRVFVGENVVAPMLAEGKMAVVASDENGEHELKFVVDKELDEKEIAVEYLRDRYGKTITHWERAPVSVEMASKDGKLAIVYSLTNSYGTIGGGLDEFRTGYFWLGVYDETGIIYAGEYGMSQGIGEFISGRDSAEMCEIRDDVEIGISWGE